MSSCNTKDFFYQLCQKSRIMGTQSCFFFAILTKAHLFKTNDVINLRFINISNVNI